jgi:surface protein
VSNETVSRISNIQSLSNTGIPTLVQNNNALITSISNETVLRNQTITSLSSAVTNYYNPVVLASTYNYSVSYSNGYAFQGDANGTNVTLNVVVGDTLVFNLNVDGHPFYIKTNAVTGSGSLVTTGTITGTQGSTTGTLSWNTFGVMPGTYFYQCEYHSSMVGTINVVAAAVSISEIISQQSLLLSTEKISLDSVVSSTSSLISNSVIPLYNDLSSLSITVSNETSNRNSEINSLSVMLSTASSSLTVQNSELSTALSTTVSSRNANITSLSNAYISIQTSTSTMMTNVTSFINVLATKATNSYLNSTISSVVNNAPNNLNTLVEIAAAIGNNTSFANSLNTVLGSLDTISNANLLSTAILTKGTTNDLDSLAVVVSSKGDSATLSQQRQTISTLRTGVSSMSSTTVNLQTTGGIANLSLNGVNVTLLQSRILELSTYLSMNQSLGQPNYIPPPNYSPPVLDGNIKYSGTGTGPYTAIMMFNVQSGVTSLSGFKSDLNKLNETILFTQVVISPTRIQIQLTYNSSSAPFNLVVIANGNSNGLQSRSSLPISIKAVSLIMLDANGVTLMFTGGPISQSPSFQYLNPRGYFEWFAVVNDTSKNHITNYSNNVANASSVFVAPSTSTAVGFNNIVTTLMTDTSSLFNNLVGFNQTIESWDLSNVTNMSNMFYGSSFNNIINLWNVSNVKNMNGMFQNNSQFDKDIGSWNTSTVTSMESMFQNASLFNQYIGGWNVSNVIVKPPSNFRTGATMFTSSDQPNW